MVFSEPPGSYDICEICFWEDDVAQLRWPNMSGGANTDSLIDSQRNFSEFGAVERRLLEHVRPARADEPIEPGWRPVDPTLDDFEPLPGPRSPSTYWSASTTEYPRDSTVLYYWRSTFWRASVRLS